MLGICACLANFDWIGLDWIGLDLGLLMDWIQGVEDQVRGRAEGDGQAARLRRPLRCSGKTLSLRDLKRVEPRCVGEGFGTFNSKT